MCVIYTTWLSYSTVVCGMQNRKFDQSICAWTLIKTLMSKIGRLGYNKLLSSHVLTHINYMHTYVLEV